MKIKHNRDRKSVQSTLDTLTTSLDTAMASRPWLSNSHVQTLLRGAAAAKPAVREAFSDHLRTLLQSDHPPRMSKRSLQLACAFVHISPATVASSSFERVTPAKAERNQSVATGFAQNLARGLREIALQQSQGEIDTPEKAQAFADQSLRLALAKKGVLHDAAVNLQLAPEHFALINNQRGMKAAIVQTATFLAELAKDHGGELRLDVRLLPKEGALAKRSGGERDTLFVPLSRGLSAAELRQQWSEGAFIRPGNVFNPFDHLRAGKLRAIWRLGRDPVGPLRTGLRRVFARSARDIGRSIERVIAGDDRKTHASELVRRFVSADAKTDAGQPLRENVIERFSAMSEVGLCEVLTRWKAVVGDADFAEALGEAATSSALHIIHGERIGGALHPALVRHADGAIDEVALSGRGLIDMRDDDVIAVEPNLARTLLGGAALERALTK